MRIKRLHGNQDQYWDAAKSCAIAKSAISKNLCESVVQTSYDIVKAHGGEIKVKSVEGKGSEFIIQTPANKTKK